MTKLEIITCKTGGLEWFEATSDETQCSVSAGAFATRREAEIFVERLAGVEIADGTNVYDVAIDQFFGGAHERSDGYAISSGGSTLYFDTFEVALDAFVSFVVPVRKIPRVTNVWHPGAEFRL